ncbi:MAG: hypothetical protein QOF15_4311, partial [Mycobacterium sp.]|nr:hypothetical protein [Mycobacterium sp.]
MRRSGALSARLAGTEPEALVK